MSVKERIIKRLDENLHPFFLKVEDLSDSFIGRSGLPDGAETHFRLFVVSDNFIGKSLAERHRIIYSLLNDEIRAGLHSLQIKTMTVEEARLKNPPEISN